MRHLLTSDVLDSKETQRIGLVQGIVAPDQTFDHAIKLSAHVPLGVQQANRLLQKLK